jgi:hypothetical protein
LLGGELIVRTATLTKYTPGARTPGALNAGTNTTSVTYDCEGIVEAFETGMIDGTTVRREDRKISLRIATLPTDIEPKPNDRIAIDGTTYVVVSTDGRDAAKFNFVCHGRKA